MEEDEAEGAAVESKEKLQECGWTNEKTASRNLERRNGTKKIAKKKVCMLRTKQSGSADAHSALAAGSMEVEVVKWGR